MDIYTGILFIVMLYYEIIWLMYHTNELLNIVIRIINNVMAYKKTITINFSFKLLGYYRDNPMENKSNKMQSLFL
jgi:hypothetical protein